MGSGGPTQGGRRIRRRKSSLTPTQRVLDAIILLLLLLLPVGVIWVLGGNRIWIMGPAILWTLVAGVLFAIRMFLLEPREGLRVPPGGLALGGLLVYLAALIPFAEIPGDAARETFRFIGYTAAYWMLFHLLGINQRWRGAMAAVLLSVSVMAWYALIQEVQGTNMVLNQPRPEQYGMRASGAFICPNHFAHLLQMLVPVCVGLVACRGLGLPLRLIAGYTALVSLPALLLTESRSGWIGLLAGLVVFAIAANLRRGAKRVVLTVVVAPLAAVAAGLLAWWLSPTIQTRVAYALQGDIRIPLWQDSLKVALFDPLWGSGLGAFRWMILHFREHLTIYTDPEFAHNDYLQYWIETGVAGLALMLAVGAVIAVRAVRTILRSPEPRDVWLMAGLLGAMAGSAAHAFFDFNFHIFGNVMVYVFVLAALSAAANGARLEREIALPPGRAKGVGVALLVVLVGLGGWYGRELGSVRYRLQAERAVAAVRWDEAVNAYERALAWSPNSWRAHIGLAHLLRTRSYWVRQPELKREWMDRSRLHYERSLALNPWEADATYGLGTLYKLAGDDERALALRRQVVEQVPRHVFYLNELGIQLKDMGRYEEALQVFQESRSVEDSPVAARNIRWLRERMAAEGG